MTKLACPGTKQPLTMDGTPLSRYLGKIDKAFVPPWPKLVTISRWNDQPVFGVAGLEGLI